jgi:membrane protease YdiL (CAAX protease family)
METFLVFLTFAPLIFILWLANLGEMRRLRPLVAYLLVALFYGSLIGFGIILQIIGAAATGPMAESLGETYAQIGIDPQAFARMGLGLWLPCLFGVLFLLPLARKLAGRLLPAFRPDSPVHTVALSYTALVVANLLFTVGMGIGNIANMMQQAGPTDLTPSLWTQEIMMAVMALVGVGWLARRSLAEGLQRLAIVKPNLRQALAGACIGAGLAVLIVILEALLGKVGIVTDADVQKLSEQLLGPLVQGPFGIITLGLAAALGEETLFRGALQPRFGLLFTTLLFALLHSTYGLSLATVFVFGIGLVLGLVRLRANTTTSMIVHAIYNMTLGVIAALGLLQNI